MARPKTNGVNIEALRKLYKSVGSPLNLDGVFAFIMIESGATYQNVADVLGVKDRQRAEYYYKHISEAIK